LKGILERLNAGEVVIGDGGYITEMERRGFATAGPWTPEVNVEHPHAGRFVSRLRLCSITIII
jgi:betaine-homocysteine S-methyltransferase